MIVDHASLAPIYALAGALVLVLLADLALGPHARRRVETLIGIGAVGLVTTGALAIAVTGGTSRRGFCVDPETLPGEIAVGQACSLETNRYVVAVIVGACVAALLVLAYSVRHLSTVDDPLGADRQQTAQTVATGARSSNAEELVVAGRASAAGGRFGDVALGGVQEPSSPRPLATNGAMPGATSASFAGEYILLLLCSVLGLVTLASARDIITLIVAIETLTLPTYALVSLGRGARAAQGATTYFVVSVASTAIALLGAALFYVTTGALHLEWVARVLSVDSIADKPLVTISLVLLLSGLLFKLAAVPFHAWAPATYDGAPVPVTAYLATLSKVGGWLALVLVVGAAARQLDVLGPVLAVVAIATMLVGNLVALRQHRLMRLLAWSSIGQLGFALAALGAARSSGGFNDAVAASATYVALYVLISLAVFGAIIAVMPAAGGIDDLRGLARRSPVAAGVLVIGLAGLAGLPPGFAGLWAKLAVLRGVVRVGDGWPMWVLVGAIAVSVVVGLAVYLRVVAAVFTPSEVGDRVVPDRAALSAALLATVVGLVVGVYPQPLFESVTRLGCGLFSTCS